MYEISNFTYVSNMPLRKLTSQAIHLTLSVGPVTKSVNSFEALTSSSLAFLISLGNFGKLAGESKSKPGAELPLAMRYLSKIAVCLEMMAAKSTMFEALVAVGFTWPLLITSWTGAGALSTMFCSTSAIMI